MVCIIFYDWVLVPMARDRQTVMKQIHPNAAIEMPNSAVMGTHNTSPLI